MTKMKMVTKTKSKKRTVSDAAANLKAAKAASTAKARTPLRPDNETAGGDALVPVGKGTRSAKPAKGTKPAAAGGERPDGLRQGSKQAQMIDLALRDEGATEKAICADLGWKKCRVTLKRVAEKIGAKLEGKKNVAGETVWYASMPKV